MSFSVQIRQMVGQALNRDAVTGELATALAQRYFAAGQFPDPMLINQQVMFLRNYVGHTADLLDGLRAAARRAGVSAQVEPLLETAARYFVAPIDVIPDHLGLVGLVDDAYLCGRLLQAASARHQATVGVPLLARDLTQENAVVRQLIGEPQASQLETIIDTATSQVSFDKRVDALGSSTQTLDNVEDPWREDPTISASDAAILSSLRSGKKVGASRPPENAAQGGEWRGPAITMLDTLRRELKTRSESGEIKGGRQQNLEQVLNAVGGMLDVRHPELDESISQAQKVRDLMGRMLGGIAKPSSRITPAAPDSRLARVQALVGAMKVDLAAEVMSGELSDGEHSAAMDLYVRCGHATTALQQLIDRQDALVDLEGETLRQLAMDLRSFAARHHLMVIEPIWMVPPGAQQANVLFYSGGTAVQRTLAAFCRERAFELTERPAARRYADTRWRQLLAANGTVFDLTVPAAEERAAVCYELGIALTLGRGIVIVADTDTVIPFDVHIAPVLIDASDSTTSLATAIDAAVYERQFGGGDSALARTLQYLRSTLAMSENARVRQMLGLFGDEAEADPILFRSRLGSLIGLIGNDAPRMVTPAWPGRYPGEEPRCFHVMPFGRSWADDVRNCVARVCADKARYVRGDEVDDPRIIRSIWDEICRATHVVVDITDFNPNVALELGMAHALGRRTLIVAQQGRTIDRLFRSIAKLRVHPYSINDLDGTLGRSVRKFVNSQVTI